MQFWSFWIQHTPIFSILIPMFTAVALVALGNSEAGQFGTDWRVPWRRGLSLISASLGVATAISYLYIAQTGQIVVYALGEWNAPFGIVLVLDRLSALMVMLSSSLGLLSIWQASRYWDLQGRYFHAMLHFLLMGLHGAFLTGDLFNLFVFFEILLLASYVLLLHGQGKARFQTGIHYVSINLVASALFLLGLGLIYGNIGSLNMADVARILPSLQGTQQQLASAGGLLLFVVFGIKAAMLPVGFWLPKSYAVASTPVAVIFMLMTKVGIYALLRVNGLVFAGSNAFATWQHWLLPLALIGSVYGVLAAMAAQRLKRFIGFMLLSSLSTLLIAIVLMNGKAIAALLYYLLHSTLVAAAFYLLCEWIHSQRGSHKDHLHVAEQMPAHNRIGLCFLLLAWMMVGLPPFSGFMGKLMLLQAALEHAQQFWIFAVVLSVSLMSMLAFCRVGFILFWKALKNTEVNGRISLRLPAAQQHASAATPATRAPTAVYALSLSLLLLLLFTPQVYRYSLATASQLLNPHGYTQAVLTPDAQGRIISVQPFDSGYVPETKYHGATPDRNATLVPHIISPATLNGEHITPQQAPTTTLLQPPTRSIPQTQTTPLETNLPDPTKSQVPP